MGIGVALLLSPNKMLHVAEQSKEKTVTTE